MSCYQALGAASVFRLKLVYWLPWSSSTIQISHTWPNIPYASLVCTWISPRFKFLLNKAARFSLSKVKSVLNLIWCVHIGNHDQDWSEEISTRLIQLNQQSAVVLTLQTWVVEVVCPVIHHQRRLTHAEPRDRLLTHKRWKIVDWDVKNDTTLFFLFSINNSVDGHFESCLIFFNNQYNNVKPDLTTMFGGKRSGAHAYSR